MLLNYQSYFQDLLVIDIETVCYHKSFSELDERMQALWTKKASFLKNEDNLDAAELYAKKAAIYAEFGKVVCIAVGFFARDEDQQAQLRVKAFHSDDEAEILNDFNDLINNGFNSDQLRLVAHNGKEFDFPYLCRRMLVRNIEIPVPLQIRGKKPWEIQHIDTMELWKFGDMKNYTSLDLLAALFEIPSSKDDIDGSMISHVYHNENDLERIAEYCKKDVVVTAQLLLRLSGFEIIEKANIHVL